MQLCLEGYALGDMPSSNAVWISFLLNNGFEEHSLSTMCKDCYTLEKFIKDIGVGKYIVGDGSHVVAVIREPNDPEAKFYDSWNSRNIVPIYYF